ncbi:MAG: fumarylacetoacetate hydrolase family protein [Candidatus Sericytochromatia bacterium]
MTFVLLKNSNFVKEKISVPKIFCLGSNYLDHIKEMGNKIPTEPVIFMKPSTAIIRNEESILIPDISKEAHHEVELVLLIEKDGKNIKPENSLEYISAIGIGLDITLRDLQKQAKESGKPWVIAKGFDTSAPLSDFISIKKIPDLNNINFVLYVNNEIKQKGNSGDMIFKFPQIISYISNIFTLQKGDIIFTGTPHGVNKINKGDKLKAVLENYIELNVNVN